MADDEQWDDLAIMKAFDAAVNKRKAKPAKHAPRTASHAPTHHSAAPHTHALSPPKSPAVSHRSVPMHTPPPAVHGGIPGSSFQAHQSTFPPPEATYYHSHGYATPSHAAFPAHNYPPSTPPHAAYPSPHAAHTQHTPRATEQYADAYARAYAHAMTQGASPSFAPHPAPACPYGCQQQHGGLPGMPGLSPPMVQDDDLSKLLLSWYQSGYYAGRYKAMQENKTSTFFRR
ncbi:hypothetical protein SPRG_04519 [Saprolegnia parasitica CBS 223.65]|uniref:Survival motor neuron Tudor domain-containing protein n=1 Tax=Saprolegnia parasitica (strain CBS 223.65) TaxID=695850 RepID=A0A067CIR4_SAPPC|nr:hypothetical protein SPRG_04519 [Saprolegnia parasitica CBS 223.65]KDO30619.1 hypothetical protein SPRG_04519 [Saprolegnia parasitica CBS 223.65]|eukprot:XP_012198830.1 hypothetical protein SPRG_04519 [Saprolegnia parasitica CBS 223.65]